MKTNKLYNNIKQQFENRTLEPSASAWERLSVQLDEQPQQKKKGWFFYTGIAASILALISIGIYLFSNDDKMVAPKQIIVKETIDTILIKNKIDEIFNEIPAEKVIVKNDKIKKNLINKDVAKNNVTANNAEKYQDKKEKSLSNNKKFVSKKLQNNSSIIAKVEKNDKIIPNSDVSEINANTSKKDLKIKKNRIKVNSEDLLYAVTHSKSEVNYAKYNVTKDDVLKTIKSELKKSNINVSPETILAEVERTINDDAFQNNFLNTLKNKITNIATTIAKRNN